MTPQNMKVFFGVGLTAYLGFQGWMGINIQTIAKSQSALEVSVKSNTEELKSLKVISDKRYRSTDAARDFKWRDHRDEDQNARLARLERLHVEK